MSERNINKSFFIQSVSPGKRVRVAALKYCSHIKNKPQVAGWGRSGSKRLFKLRNAAGGHICKFFYTMKVHNNLWNYVLYHLLWFLHVRPANQPTITTLALCKTHWISLGEIIQQIKITRHNQFWVGNSKHYENSWCYGIEGRHLNWRDYTECNETKRR